jgi:hypothetical protein
MKIEEYIKCLTIYINQHEKSNQLELNTPINKIKNFKCHGDFCKIKSLRLPHLSIYKIFIYSWFIISK